MDRVLLVMVALLASACATATNMRGRAIQLERHEFRHDGHALEYFLGSPQGVRTASLPIAVYLEGDVGECQEFSEGMWRRFIIRYTGDYVLVRPRTNVNTVCGTELFKWQDFNHRVQELRALVDALDERHGRRRLFLIGASAGAQVALSYWEEHKERVSGIVNLGGGVHDLREVIPAVVRAKALANGTPHDEVMAELAELETTVKLLRRSGPTSEAFWKRTRRFWHQMFFASLLPRWRRFDGRALVVHGTEDVEHVPFGLVQPMSDELGGQHLTFLFVRGVGHDLTNAHVMRKVDDWIRSVR